MKITPLAFAIALSLVPAAGLAQGNNAANQTADTGDASTDGGPVAEVGANTVNGVTTGISGPDQGGGGGPPDLTAALCEAWTNTPAHQDCLSKVLGTEIAR